MDKLVDAVSNLGLKLESHHAEQFETYYHELIDWNQRINLTAITDYEEVQVKHFLDSLTVVLAYKRQSEKSTHRAIDIGTGAGFPGVPLKIMMPELHMTLLEATTKKVIFVRHIIETLGLKDIEVLAGRAEEIGHQTACRERYDLVLSRSVASLPALAELALPFCAISGRFVAQKQTEAKSEIEQAQNAVRILGGSLRETIDINIPYLARNRCLVVYDKVSPTPPKYSRRPGVPAKKPLQ
jgi:16S rRNA (guanine527-N7)-methyltransferase